jgi:hypothetical protein
MAEANLPDISTDELNKACRETFRTLWNRVAQLMKQNSQASNQNAAMKEDQKRMKAEIQRLLSQLAAQEIAQRRSQAERAAAAAAAAAEIERLKETTGKLENEANRAIAEYRRAKTMLEKTRTMLEEARTMLEETRTMLEKTTRDGEKKVASCQKQNAVLSARVNDLKREKAEALALAKQVRADAAAALQSSTSENKNFSVPKPERVDAIRRVLCALFQTPGFDPKCSVLIFQVADPERVGDGTPKPEHFIAIVSGNNEPVLGVAGKENHNGSGFEGGKKRIFDPEGYLPAAHRDGAWATKSFNTRNGSYDWLKELNVARKFGSPSVNYGILFGGTRWYSCQNLFKMRAGFRIKFGKEAGDRAMENWLSARYSELWAGLVEPAAGPAPAVEVAIQLPGGLKRPAPEPEQAADDAEVVVVVDDDGAEPPEKRARLPDGAVETDEIDGISFTSADSMDALNENSGPEPDPDPDPVPRVREVAGRHRDGSGGSSD